MIVYPFIFQLFIPVFVLLFFLLIGRTIEQYHFKRLQEREKAFSDMIVTNLKTVPPQLQQTQVFLVMGSAVLATDYFKVFAAGIRTLVGGEVKSYVNLMERARREAMLRMLEQARAVDAKIVWNVRYETSTMQGQNEKKPGGVEILVYGTALK